MTVSTKDGPRDQALKVLYTDVDGTLLGPGGSLFAGARGVWSGEAAAALMQLRRAGVELVLMSGRTRRGLHEVARVLGASAYIAELGGLLIVGADEPIEDTGAFAGPGALPDALSRSGVAGLLLERFRDRLEPVAPWTEVSVMFQGLVDVHEVEAVLEEAGFGWLRFRDNGRLRRLLPQLDVTEGRAYHLLPRGVSKASACSGIARSAACPPRPRRPSATRSPTWRSPVWSAGSSWSRTGSARSRTPRCRRTRS